MDWADNAASEAVRNCSVSPPLGNINRDDLMPVFAAQLRKAKADGMREAADMIDQSLLYAVHDDDWNPNSTLREIRAKANKSEQPSEPQSEQKPAVRSEASDSK